MGIESRKRLAAIDVFTGNTTGWNPNTNNSVLALVINGNDVYTGGTFTSIGGIVLPGFSIINQ
jgi:hypothetical protein